MNKRNLLKLFFILVIIASGSYFVYDYLERQKSQEIFEEPVSSIVVKDEEKKEYHLEDGSNISLSPDVDLNAKRREYNNNDIVGRLEIPGMFNVLVAKGKDNKFYLDRDVKKKSDVRGTEFLDYRLNVNSQQINIYGHNTRDERIKVPFQKLTKFLNKNYFDENPYIVFQTDNEREYYKIMSIKEIDNDKEHLRVDYKGEEFVNHLNRLLSGSNQQRSVRYNENSKIMILQTCSYSSETAYYLIIAKKI